MKQAYPSTFKVYELEFMNIKFMNIKPLCLPRYILYPLHIRSHLLEAVANRLLAPSVHRHSLPLTFGADCFYLASINIHHCAGVVVASATGETLSRTLIARLFEIRHFRGHSRVVLLVFDLQ